MRDRIITTGIGIFLAPGSVGGLEQGTMNLGQAALMILIGIVLIWIGMRERR